VWALASDSPNLSTFWSGGRDGWVFKLSNLKSDHECIAICKEEYPILALTGLDNGLIWTGTTQTDINCYSDIHFSTELPPTDENDMMLIPSCAIVCDVFDEDVRSNVPSAFHSHQASANPTVSKSPLDSGSAIDVEVNEEFDSVSCVKVEPVWKIPLQVIEGGDSIKRWILLNNKRNVLVLSNKGAVEMWDIIRCRKVKTFKSGLSFDDVLARVNTQEWIANWCQIDTKTGIFKLMQAA
jgi:WD repeat-containing protein 48